MCVALPLLLAIALTSVQVSYSLILAKEPDTWRPGFIQSAPKDRSGEEREKTELALVNNPELLGF